MCPLKESTVSVSTYKEGATWIFFCFAHSERNRFFAATDQGPLSFQIAFVQSATDVAHVVIGRVFMHKDRALIILTFDVNVFIGSGYKQY